MNGIGKILPIDGYDVRFKGNLIQNYGISLTHLYQPLIGMKAVMLYQTLLHEYDLQLTSLQTHHSLMNYIDLPLNEIYAARLKLEGIGLLNTYENNLPDKRYFIYELKSPLSPTEFFNDALFSELLSHHIGDDKCKRLRQILCQQEQNDLGKNITASFNQVFTTIPQAYEEISATTEVTQEGQTVELEPIDFAWLEQMLTQRMVPAHKVLTNLNKQVITQLAHLYDLASFEIEKAILWALTEENELDLDEFRDACHDLFKQKGQSIRLTPKPAVVPQPLSAEEETVLSKEEQLIRRLEVITPKQLLEDFSSGHQASEQDLKMISEIMVSQGLPMPVMNVLIHYVLLQSDMKLTKSYLQTIASHWSRANLKTAREAMAFAKEQIKKFKTAKTNQKPNYYQRQRSREVVPDWFKERKKQKKAQPQVQQKPIIDEEKERHELEKLIKQMTQSQPK